VYIGAIVTVAGNGGAGGSNNSSRTGAPVNAPQLLLGAPFAYSELLGQTMVDRVVHRLRAFGVEHVSVISEGVGNKIAVLHDPQGSHGFWSAWDSIVSRFLNQGIEELLLLRLGPYVEIDVPDLVRFHHASADPLTQVYDSKGPLDLVLVNAAELKQGNGSYRSRLSNLIPHRSRYRFSGYSNRLNSPSDFRRLVNDGLLGRCAIHPVGKEVHAGIWMNDYAVVDHTARIHAPAYIGAGTRIGAACAIGGSCAIEQGCEIDCGTTIEDCCIFPHTYVGLGLNLRHSIVSGSKLFNLKRNVEMQFNDRHLIANTLASRNQLTNATSRILRPVRSASRSGLSARVSKVASLMSNRWLGSSG
jgi:carbonic anhydrase/acetyltransferase-like protein (isoleucine patch superfamily)